jgi:hypothetical protein
MGGKPYFSNCRRQELTLGNWPFRPSWDIDTCWRASGGLSSPVINLMDQLQDKFFELDEFLNVL